MSYNVPTSYYWNPGNPAYGPGFDEPVPGWGFRPNMVGPRRVGVDGLGTVVVPDSAQVALQYAKSFTDGLSREDGNLVVMFFAALETCCGFKLAEGDAPQGCAPPGSQPYETGVGLAKTLAKPERGPALGRVLKFLLPQSGTFAGKMLPARAVGLAWLRAAGLRVTDATTVPPKGPVVPPDMPIGGRGNAASLAPSTTAGVALGLVKLRKTLTGDAARAFDAFTMAAEACGKKACQPGSPQAQAIIAAAAALPPSVREQAYAIASQSKEPLPTLLAAALKGQDPQESPPVVAPQPKGVEPMTVALYAGGALLLGAVLVYALKGKS